VRDPGSGDLWIFWINRPKGTWKQRTPLAFARSGDHGATWSPPQNVEHEPKRGYGYVSVTVVKEAAILTYYDWADEGQPSFQRTHLRQRTIPLAWLRGVPAPPVFRKSAAPVVHREGRVISVNSGVLVEGDRWRLWSTRGTLGPEGERLKLHYAESADEGVTWKDVSDLGFGGSTYHASAHREGDALVLYAWRREGEARNGLYRLVSRDDSRTFAAEPDRPLIASQNASQVVRDEAGEGRVSNDAFDMIQLPGGGYAYFAAVLERASDDRAVIRHDNASGRVRVIGRAVSGDGVEFSPVEVVLRPDYAFGDPYDTQFYGMQVLIYRGFHIGLLHVFHADAQTIQPEWAWSHDGQSWARTYDPAIALGDEGAFDSRMILFGNLAWSGDEIVWLYSGANWRHNAYKQGEVTTAIGRATLTRKELDAWVDSLPRP
jgi:hypothetical protein